MEIKYRQVYFENVRIGRVYLMDANDFELRFVVIGEKIKNIDGDFKYRTMEPPARVGEAGLYYPVNSVTLYEPVMKEPYFENKRLAGLVARYSERLEFDPGGSDKIDELEDCIRHKRIERGQR